uniref:Transmembrane region domain-containing protein n=1 Tax=Escherichia phage 121/2022-2B TaxID=3103121 RepID=A0AAU6NTH5_9VIRU
MILKTRWYDLDDGDDGISVDRVDWSGCSEDTKKRLIREFRMGYQAVKPSMVTDDKFVCIHNGRAKLTNAEWFTDKIMILWYIISLPVSSFVFYFFIKNPMDRIGDWILLTILVNIFTASILSGIWYMFIEMPWRMRRQQKIFDEKKYAQNLNNFITECRKLK